jgi:hypothetical protein
MSRWRLAQTLLHRGAPGDRARAVALLSAASTTARSLGMRAFAQEIAATHAA